MEPVKIITFANKKYTLRVTAFTIIDYNSTFNSDVFNDLATLELKKDSNKNKNQQKLEIDNFDFSKIIKPLTQIFYIMQVNRNKTYQEFMEQFKVIDLLNTENIKSLMDAIIDLFSIKKKQQQKK